METGPRLKVSSDRLVKPGIDPATPGSQGKWHIHYSTAAPNMLVDLRTIIVASTKFQTDYGKASPRMSALSLTIIHGKNNELYSSKLINEITRLSTLCAFYNMPFQQKYF